MREFGLKTRSKHIKGFALLLASNSRSSGIVAGSLFTNEEHKGLAHDVFNTFVTHADVVCGVTDRDW